MCGPRQNLLRNVVKTFSFNICFRHSYSKMCKNVTLSGRHNYSDVIMSRFERLTSFMYECDKLYIHRCRLKIEEMTTLDDLTARRTVINFCVEGGMTPIQTLKQMQSTDRYKNVSKQLVYKWHGRFSNGLTDSSPRGRPPYKDKKQTLAVKNVIESDRRKTVREVAVSAGCSKSTAQRVLTADLGMSHVSARWVPRLLTEEEKSARVSASRRFLDRSRSDPTFLDRIITTDETWVHYYEPEDKRMSMVWKNRDSQTPKKAKVVKSMGKVMCVVFMDSSGVILVHMVPSGRTVNAEYYSKVNVRIHLQFFKIFKIMILLHK